MTADEIQRSFSKWTPGFFWGMTTVVVLPGNRGRGPWDDILGIDHHQAGVGAPKRYLGTDQ